MQYFHIIITLINFLAAAILGVMMRYAFVGDLGILSYRHIMHAHSHIAMMGWIFMSLYILIIYHFVPRLKRDQPIYKNLFLGNQVIVGLMGAAFIVQGYGPVSILLAGLHVLISYVYTYHVWKDLEYNTPSVLMLRTALMWMVLSTLGLWLLPVVIQTEGRMSEYYFMCVQFFLHFQFNGWFIFSILALFFHKMEKEKITISASVFKYFYITLVVSCFLTYALAITWSTPEDLLFATNSLGVILQLVALILLLKIISGITEMNTFFGSNFSRIFYAIAIFSLILKIIIQAAVVVPSIAVVSYTIRQFVIGFIHLTLLGAVSGFVIALFLEYKMIPSAGKSGVLGLSMLIIGLAGTEMLLFGQGILLWAESGYINGYYKIMLLLSTVLMAGILLIIIAVIKQNQNKKISAKEKSDMLLNVI